MAVLHKHKLSKLDIDNACCHWQTIGKPHLFCPQNDLSEAPELARFYEATLCARAHVPFSNHDSCRNIADSLSLPVQYFIVSNLFSMHWECGCKHCAMGQLEVSIAFNPTSTEHMNLAVDSGASWHGQQLDVLVCHRS